MRRSAHAYRLSLLLALACGLVLSGWHWQQVGLQGWGIGWLLLLPWRHKLRGGALILALLVSGLAGFVIASSGAAGIVVHLGSALASLALALWFLRTLLPPHTALITAIGEASRGPLEPALRLYTRRMTAMWGLLLLACGLISLGYLLLPALAPLAWLPAWQLPLSVALFIGEFYLRKRLFPTHNHPGFKEYLMIVAKAMAHPPRTR